jgi:hypothetical protein
MAVPWCERRCSEGEPLTRRIYGIDSQCIVKNSKAQLPNQVNLLFVTVLDVAECVVGRNRLLSLRSHQRKEPAMYMAIRKYQTTTGASIQEIVQRVQEGFVPIISQNPGFVAYYILDTGSETVASVSLFQDQAGADESTRRASEWVRQNLTSLLQLPAQLTAGEVVYSKTS